MPTRPLARAAAVLVALALLLPATAAAQQAPSLGAPTETQAPVVTTTGTDNGGLKGWQQGLIVAAGIALLLGIGWAIVGDARQHAPVEDRRHRGELEAAGGPRLSPHERRRRKERARAKGRAARKARKANR